MKSKSKKDLAIVLGAALVCISILGFVYAQGEASPSEPVHTFVSRSYTQTVDGELVVFNEVCEVGVDAECAP